MRRTLPFIALLAWLSTASAAPAEPPNAALRLYAAGEFVAAAEAADLQRSAANLAFASRALVAACAAAQSPVAVDALLARAEDHAQQALTLDADSVDARLQLALVYGMEGRRVSLTRAITGGYAVRGKRLIDEAIARDPDNAHAQALLGAWHLEVLRRGGTAGALFYGARARLGVAAFERARRLAPNDTLIALHYAVALLALDPNAYASRAAGQLEMVTSAHPSDAIETLANQTAQTLRAALELGPRAAQRVARETIL